MKSTTARARERTAENKLRGPWSLRDRLVLGMASLICLIGFAHIVGSCVGPKTQEEAEVLVAEQNPAQKAAGVLIVEKLDAAKAELEVAKLTGNIPKGVAAQQKVEQLTKEMVAHLQAVAAETGQEWGMIAGAVGGSVLGLPPALGAALAGMLGLQGAKMFTPGSRGLELMIGAYRKMGKLTPGGEGAPDWRGAARLLIASTGMAHSTKASKEAVKTELKVVKSSPSPAADKAA